jgi:hypothetical protein
MERETGIEPATNGLGSRDSTTELLPLRLLFRDPRSRSGFRLGARGARKTPHVTPARNNTTILPEPRFRLPSGT